MIRISQRTGMPPAAVQTRAQTSAVSPLRFSATDKSLVSIRREGPIAVIGLSHPENANRLSRPMIAELLKTFTRLETDPKITHIVFASDHPKIFCPGAAILDEIKQLQSTTQHLKQKLRFIPNPLRDASIKAVQLPNLIRYGLIGTELFNRIEASPKITVALVNGMSVGGGVELPLACDYIVATPNAQFTIPEVKYGIFPDWGATERLPQRIGKALSKFLILEGGFMADKGISGPATITANDAKLMGLVDVVVPAENLEASLADMLAGPRFQEKPHRPTSAQELAQLDAEAEKRVMGSRFESKYYRYQSKPLEDLIHEELKGLYPPTLRLTNRRIEQAPHVNPWAHRKDLVQMFWYFATLLSEKPSSP